MLKTKQAFLSWCVQTHHLDHSELLKMLRQFFSCSPARIWHSCLRKPEKMVPWSEMRALAFPAAVGEKWTTMWDLLYEWCREPGPGNQGPRNESQPVLQEELGRLGFPVFGSLFFHTDFVFSPPRLPCPFFLLPTDIFNKMVSYLDALWALERHFPWVESMGCI